MRHRGPVAPWKTHPLTGLLLEPVGYRKDGRPIHPILGAAEDGEEDEQGQGGDAGNDSGAAGSGGGEDGSGDSGTGSDNDTVSREEFEKVMARLKAADQRASALEAEKKKAEDAKKDDLQRAQDQVKDLEEKVSGLTDQINALRLGNAFLSVNDHVWHDPDTALDIASRNGYLDDALTDDGEVDKKVLKKALDRLATEKEFLVKKDSAPSKPGEPSGEPAGGRSGNQNDKGAQRAALKKRFPALR